MILENNLKIIKRYTPRKLRKLLILTKFKLTFILKLLQEFIPYIRRINALIEPMKILKKAFSISPTFIISYPKCGRTWLRVLIGKYICSKFNLSDDMILKTFQITKFQGLHPTQFSHDTSSWNKKIVYRFDNLPFKKNFYKDKKIIFLTKNLKDTLVSSYFHVKKRDKIYSDTITKFIRSDIYGVKKVLAFNKIWYQNKKITKEFLHISYENLHNDIKNILIKCLKFIGFKKIDEVLLEESIKFSNINSMKKLEKKNYFHNPILKPSNIYDNESYKVRKGIIGGYKSYLSEDDISYINKITNEIGNPFKI